MNTKPSVERVFQIFKELNHVPRPSHHEERVADYLCQFAQRHHLDYQRDAHNCVVIPSRAVSPEEFLLAHAIVALPAFLTNDGKVEQHLADAVGDAEEESLEAEDAAVFQMGVDTPDVLHAPACLGKVRDVNHQTGIFRLVVTADDDLRPELADNMVHQLAPVRATIVEEHS